MISRRDLLIVMGAASLTAGAALAWRSLRESLASGGFDWDFFIRMMPSGGVARILSLAGEAMTAMGALMADSVIESGERITVAPGSVLTLTLPDRTVMRIRGEAELDLHVDAFSGGMYHLLLGAILSVVPTGNRHVALGPTASVGIKGTVFYREVFGPDTRIARTMEGKMPVPEGVDDYFCNCHGEVTYLPLPGGGGAESVDTANHHNSFFLTRNGGLKRIRAPMLNHFDDDIDSLIDLMEGEKHDKSWLDLRKAIRPAD